jgi:uncharacterized protein (TIGR02246 family)
VPGDEGAEIRSVLHRSATAWSAGDLAGFMACYENSPDTLYLTGTKVVLGYDSIHAMYAARFDACNAGARGALSMTLLAVKLLGPEHAIVLGRYTLDRNEALGGSVAGPFSLVFHRTPAGWRIAADHTS